MKRYSNFLGKVFSIFSLSLVMTLFYTNVFASSDSLQPPTDFRFDPSDRFLYFDWTNASSATDFYIYNYTGEMSDAAFRSDYLNRTPLSTEFSPISDSIIHNSNTFPLNMDHMAALMLYDRNTDTMSEWSDIIRWDALLSPINDLSIVKNPRTPGRLKLDWSDNYNATHFAVRVYTGEISDSSFDSSYLNSIPSNREFRSLQGDYKEWSFNTEDDKSYSVAIMLKDVNGVVSEWSNIAHWDAVELSLSSVQDLKIVKNPRTPGRLKLDWSNNHGATHFAVAVYTGEISDSSFNSSYLNSTPPTRNFRRLNGDYKEWSFNAEDDKSYSVAIMLKDANGVVSEWSNIAHWDAVACTNSSRHYYQFVSSYADRVNKASREGYKAISNLKFIEDCNGQYLEWTNPDNVADFDIRAYTNESAYQSYKDFGAYDSSSTSYMSRIKALTDDYQITPTKGNKVRIKLKNEVANEVFGVWYKPESSSSSLSSVRNLKLEDRFLSWTTPTSADAYKIIFFTGEIEGVKDFKQRLKNGDPYGSCNLKKNKTFYNWGAACGEMFKKSNVNFRSGHKEVVKVLDRTLQSYGVIRYKNNVSSEPAILVYPTDTAIDLSISTWSGGLPKLSWTNYASSHIYDSSFDGYALFLRKGIWDKSKVTWEDPQYLSKNTLSYQLENLSSYTDYTVRVVPYKDKSYSKEFLYPGSDVITFKTSGLSTCNPSSKYLSRSMKDYHARTRRAAVSGYKRISSVKLIDDCGDQYLEWTNPSDVEKFDIRGYTDESGYIQSKNDNYKGFGVCASQNVESNDLTCVTRDNILNSKSDKVRIKLDGGFKDLGGYGVWYKALGAKTTKMTSDFFYNDANYVKVLNGHDYDMNELGYFTNKTNLDKDVFAYKILSALKMLGYTTSAGMNDIGKKSQIIVLNQFQKKHGLHVSEKLNGATILRLNEKLLEREKIIKVYKNKFPLYSKIAGLHKNDVSKEHVAMLYYLPFEILPAKYRPNKENLILCFSGQCGGQLKDNKLIYQNTDTPFVLMPDSVAILTLLHEYAHYLDGALYQQEEWQELIDTTGFYNISFKDVDKVGQLPFYEKNCFDRRSTNDSDFITDYALSHGVNSPQGCGNEKYTVAEDFAESFAAYVGSGKQFRLAAKKNSVIKQKYQWLKANVFDGVEYDTNLIWWNASGCNDMGAEYQTLGYMTGYMNCNEKYVWDGKIEKLYSSDITTDLPVQSTTSNNISLTNSVHNTHSYVEDENLAEKKEGISNSIKDIDTRITELKELRRSQVLHLKKVEELTAKIQDYNFIGDSAKEIATHVEKFNKEITDSELSTVELNKKKRILEQRFKMAKVKAKKEKFKKGVIPFSDTDDNEWYTEYVMDMKNSGVISGYKNKNGELTGEFKPANSVTNAEVLKMALELAGHGPSSSSRLRIDHWAKGYIQTASDLNLEFYEVARNNPDASATRLEVVKLVLQIYGTDLPDWVNYKFTDLKDTGSNGRYVMVANQKGVIDGYSDGTFKPFGLINRAETAKILKNADVNLK